MNSLNLVEDITKTLNNESNIYIENETNSSYIRYLELLDTYFSESCKPKFNNKFNYYVDDNGRFVKKAIDKSDESDSMVIVKPNYIDITYRLNELDKTIKNMETTLRQYRSGLLNNDLSIKDAFDKLYKMYIGLINERDSIKEYNKKVNNLDTNKELKLKLKLDNINLNLTQYSLFNSIKLFNEEEDIRKYLLNSEVVNGNIYKMNDLQNTTTNFIVKEVFDNKLPTKKKIKPKKFKKKQKSKLEPKVEEPELIEEEPELIEKEPELIEEEPELIEEDPTPKKVVKEEYEDNLELEEVDLSEGLADQSELDLKSLFNESDSDSEYVFNKDKKQPIDETEDLQLNLEEAIESSNRSEYGSGADAEDSSGADGSVESNEEIDLDKLSKQLNKKAKENIKIIKVDPNLQFSNITCDDSKTTRSRIKTTNVAGGKKRRKKNMDKDLKNCMFPFKEIKGKNKKEIIHDGCTDTGIEDWCATERNEDCTMKKWAYCEK